MAKKRQKTLSGQKGNGKGAVVKNKASAEVELLTARSAESTAAPRYTAADVKSIRLTAGFSQAVFGGALNVSPETIRAWEQGRKQPSGPAERLLELAQKHPTVIRGIVRLRSESSEDSEDR